MKKSAIILAFCLFATMPVFAKGKDLRDATLVKATLERPSRVAAVIAFNNGEVAQKYWWFQIQVGDLTYYAECDKGKAKQGEWQENSPVKLWFETKGGSFATRTWIHLANDKGKETELQVISILDKDDHDYCGTRKCDPESAEKKLHGQ